MQRLTRPLVPCCLPLLLLVACDLGGGSTPDPVDLTAVENALLAEINDERTQTGLPALVRDPALDGVIAWHVQTMAADHFLDHEDANGRRGEARARYYGGDDTLRCVELIQWWGGTPSGRVHYDGYYASPDHHSAYLEEGVFNLGPTTHVGVAVAVGTGPAGSNFAGRSGSYSGVLLCDRTPAYPLAIDPFAEP